MKEELGAEVGKFQKEGCAVTVFGAGDSEGVVYVLVC